MSEPDATKMTDNQQQLERLIGALLDDQPLQRAPVSLQARVLARVQARDAARGWAYGFNYWPRSAQVVFTLVALLAVKLTLQAADWGITALDRAFETVPLYQGAAMRITWIGTLAEAVTTSLQSIPALWLWSAGTLVALVYLGCLGISAVAYRILYAR